MPRIGHHTRSANERADEQSLDEFNQYIHHIKDTDQGLDWDYIASTLGPGKPAGTPAAGHGFAPTGDIQFDPDEKRIKFPLKTPVGRGFFAAYKGPFGDPGDETGFRIYIGITLATEIAIRDLPIVGRISDDALSIGGIQLLIASHDMTARECREIYEWQIGTGPESEIGDINPDKPPLPPLTGLFSRVSLRVVVRIAKSSTPLLVAFGSSGKPPAPAPADPNVTEANAKPEPPSSAATPNKQVGPVKFTRVFGDFTPADGTTADTFRLGVDILIALGPIALQLQELTLSYSLPATNDSVMSGQPTIGLRGVEVSAGEPGLFEFGGGLYVDSLNPINLWGEITANFGNSFGVALMAAYAAVDGEPSFFGFGYVKVPIGGPPFLEVQGIALGLAFNRVLNIPEADKLYLFPFIQAAMSFADPGEFANPFPSDPTTPDELINTLKILGTEIAPPSAGSYWVTLGLAFDSFKIITGFALISIAFGAKTQISAVGELQVTLPPKGPAAAEAKALVFIDEFFRVVIDISGGEFSLSTYINYNSYIVEKNAHLTGGTAVSVWFGGPHKGEFVATAGGYAPSISPPTYYPNVPRIGLSMKLGGGIQVQGKMYFAVTPSAAMLGIAFQVSGKWGPAQLWAIVGFDALIAWHPLHYTARVSLEVGATFKIKVWFVHISVTVHVGASMAIWGPPFAGQARVDLSICSISWHLGANNSPALPPPLGWDEFKRNFLTPAKPDGDLNDQQNYAVGDIQVDSDRTIILKRGRADDAQWVVDPETAVILTHSVIPSKRWAVGGDVAGQQESGLNTQFGVYPCRFAADAVTTTHTVTVTMALRTLIELNVKPRIEAVPFAQWGTGTAPAAGDGAVVKDVVVGLELHPVRHPPDRTLPADANNLLTHVAALHLIYIRPSADHSTDFPVKTVSGTIGSSTAEANRTRLFAALQDYLLPGMELDVTAQSADVSVFARGPDADLFLNPPRLHLLGEDRAGARMTA